MTLRFSIQSVLGLVLLAQAMGLQAQPAPASGNSSAPADSPTMLELFEFLGEFTTEEGEWVDPALLLEADADEQADATRRRSAGLGTEAGEEQTAPVENCVSPQCE